MKRKWLIRLGIAALLLFCAVALLTAGVAIGGTMARSERPLSPAQVAQLQEIEREVAQQVERQQVEIARIQEEAAVRMEIEAPALPQRPLTPPHIFHNGPTFFDMLGRTVNILTAVLLIAIGVKLVTQKQEPAEKAPKG